MMNNSRIFPQDFNNNNNINRGNTSNSSGNSNSNNGNGNGGKKKDAFDMLLTKFDDDWNNFLSYSTNEVQNTFNKNLNNNVNNSQQRKGQNPVKAAESDKKEIDRKPFFRDYVLEDFEEDEETKEEGSSHASGGPHHQHPEHLEKLKRQQQALEDVKSRFNALTAQLEEYKDRYAKVVAVQKSTESSNKQLKEALKALESENIELQETMKEKVVATRRATLAPMMAASAATKVKRRQTELPDHKSKEIDFKLVLADDEDHLDNDEYANMHEMHHHDLKHAFSTFMRFVFDLVPFKDDIREIRATFGMAVASYFNFMRWMMLNFSVLGVVAGVFLLIHLINLILRNDWSHGVFSSGILPDFMIYSSYSIHEKYRYILNVILGIIVLIALCMHKIVVEDRSMKTTEITELENVNTFAKEVLCSWDNSYSTEKEVNDLRGLLTETYREKLAEARAAGIQKKRTYKQFLIILGKRILGLLLYCAVQFVSYTCIALLTIRSNSIQNSLQSVQFLKGLAGFLAPAAVTAINSMTPTIYLMITNFEMWDSGQTQLNILLFRMYLSNLMNLVILAMSYAFLADPMLFAATDYSFLRRHVEKEFLSNEYLCRLDQAASGVFSLVVSEFVLNGVIYFLTGFPAKRLDNPKIYPKPIFNIAQRMVALLYFSSLMLFCFPFAPLAVVFMPFMLAARFKLEKNVTIEYYIKPRTAWAAHKTGFAFVMFYAGTLIMIAIPAAVYFLSRKTFSKDCSIQDDFIHLCSQNVDASTDVCPFDTSSPFYELYSSSKYCPEQYPACICQDACGPFIYEANAFAPFRRSLQLNTIVDFLWQYFFKMSYGAWLFSAYFFLSMKMKRNTIKVNEVASKEKERGLGDIISSLENEKKKHEKMIQRIKLIEEPSKEI